MGRIVTGGRSRPVVEKVLPPKDKTWNRKQYHINAFGAKQITVDADLDTIYGHLQLNHTEAFFAGVHFLAKFLKENKAHE